MGEEVIQFPNHAGSGWDAYKILSGSYDIPFLKITNTPRILDIGANIGAFSKWATGKWEGCKIMAFEPNKELEIYFKANTENMVDLIQKAVSTHNPLKIYTSSTCPHVNGANKHKMHDGEAEVEAVHPKSLPECEILKIDTEGSELDILTEYSHKPAIILLEAHSESDRRDIEELLYKEYEWVLGEIWARGVTEMKFVRRDILQ